MTFKDRVLAQLKPSPAARTSSDASTDGEKAAEGPEHQHVNLGTANAHNAGGVARVEAMQAVWGEDGKYLLWAGLAMVMIIFELDNTTVYNYQTFATSSFQQLSLLASIQTSQTIVSAAVKPVIAKISDVIGRGETYLITITFYVLSYILCASSATVDVYAGGAVMYAVGQSGTQVLNQIIISDISTMRWRGFAIGFSYFPFLITPWVSAFIVDSVVGGIGWRWGIGMFAILMPFCASIIVITLIYFQRRAKKAGLIVPQRMSVWEFCSLIDLGGMILVAGGFAMLLLPISLSATTPSKWSTPWIGAVIALGGVFLIGLIPYEQWAAKHPIVPPKYLKNLAIVTSCLLGAFDSSGFSCTHTYMFAWSIVTHNLSVRDATFLAYVNGVVQCLVGILVGAIMYKMRRFKYLLIAGACVRIIGYGVMIRLRGQENSLAELFVVQVIQGIGSGTIATCITVAAQIVVPHAEMAQVSSLLLLFSFLGSAVGQAVAGGIYTNALPDRIRTHLPDASDETVQQLFNSITGVLPEWGSADRIAVNYAYSDVMRYISIAALGLSVPILVLMLLMPNNKLNDSHNLVEGTDKTGQPIEDNKDEAISETVIHVQAKEKGPN